MSRELRRVPADWQHPKMWYPAKPLRSGRFDFVPLYEGKKGSKAKNRMPYFSRKKATHYQMYETVTEGTPISPVMDSPEKLAKWLAENKGGNYQSWYNMITGSGWIPSAVAVNGKLFTDVEGISAALEK